MLLFLLSMDFNIKVMLLTNKRIFAYIYLLLKVLIFNNELTYGGKDMESNEFIDVQDKLTTKIKKYKDTSSRKFKRQPDSLVTAKGRNILSFWNKFFICFAIILLLCTSVFAASYYGMLHRLDRQALEDLIDNKDVKRGVLNFRNINSFMDQKRFNAKREMINGLIEDASMSR